MNTPKRGRPARAGRKRTARIEIVTFPNVKKRWQAEAKRRGVTVTQLLELSVSELMARETP